MEGYAIAVYIIGVLMSMYFFYYQDAFVEVYGDDWPEDLLVFLCSFGWPLYLSIKFILWGLNSLISSIKHAAKNRKVKRSD